MKPGCVGCARASRFHTIGVDFVQDVSSVNEVPYSLRRLTVSPNPADRPVEIQLPGVSEGFGPALRPDLAAVA